MSSPIKILHFVETASDKELLKQELGKSTTFSCEYLAVNTKAAFEDSLLDLYPDIILCGLNIAEISTKEALVYARKIRRTIPFILVTDPVEEEFAGLIRQGLTDYIFKPSLKRLHLAISNAVAKAQLEKQLAEQNKELAGSDPKFKTLIENISDGILLLDIKARIIYQSPSVEEITGIPATATLGKTIFEFLHPSDLEAMTRYIRQSLVQPNISLQHSYRMRQGSKGNFIWVEGTVINSLQDPQIKAITINFRDITERKSAEELLQKSEANLRTIFDNTNISYVFSDRKFRILSYNSSAVFTYKKEFKVDLKEGDNLLDYIPEARRIESRQRFEKALRGEKVSYELSFQHSEENTTWYNVNMFAVRDTTGHLLGFIIASENITDRKKSELERNKMLSDILKHNKDLEQFAYIISHNLRSPVANILGISALLENTPDMDKASFDKCMAGLTLSVKKLDDVIVDLNYILQTRREINEKKEWVSFSELINDIKTSISNLIEKQNVLINTNFTVSRFFTLKSYIYSIFFNLISNSIKYHNPEVPTVIDIQSKKVNGKLVLEFRDNGLGIDLETHGRTIFGLYKKFHKHIEGKGMGLYMVKTQVEILGGKISLSSEVNKGSTFVIEFEE